MLFVEPRFLLFFLVVFAVYWGLGRNRARKVWLLLASYVFYGAWDWRFLGLIAFSTLVDYGVGLALGRCEKEGRRKLWLAVSIATNLGLLGFFKYYNFFVDSARDLFAVLGVPWSPATLDIVLPVGISFYTFQTLSYSIDVYRRQLSPTRDLLDLALFVGFFPQLVAGPIVRAVTFLPQLAARRSFAGVDVRGSLMMFLVGFVKKACIADHLAPYVDRYFAHPQLYDVPSAFAGVLYYAIQIYCDFSGYSDMAIGCAGLLGYSLCVNFEWPYFSPNITDFWHRWHVSLSTWLRDYLYIPLGGNRGGRWFVYRNLMLTMLLGGLWHGAAWHFVVWGGLHGLALVAVREWRRWTAPDWRVVRIVALLSPLLTTYWVCLAWVFFRAPDLAAAAGVARAFVFLRAPGQGSTGLELLWVVPVLALAHWGARQRWLPQWWRAVPDWSFAAYYGMAAALALSAMPADYHAFIYFQF